MSRDIYNYLKCSSIGDFSTIICYADTVLQQLNFDEIVPMSNDPKQIFKEILDGSTDDKELMYKLGSLPTLDIWRIIYQGTNYNFDLEIDEQNLEITFSTLNFPPIGVIKALKEMGINFQYIYKTEQGLTACIPEFTQTEVIIKEYEITDDCVKRAMEKLKVI